MKEENRMEEEIGLINSKLTIAVTRSEIRLECWIWEKFKMDSRRIHTRRFIDSRLKNSGISFPKHILWSHNLKRSIASIEESE